MSVPFFVVMHFLILRHTKRRALKFANFEALARVTGMELLNRNIIVLVIRLAAILALILSAAGTVIWYTGNVSEYDFVLAIDSSSSMLANDFYPTRLEAAKEAATAFVESMPSQARAGLVTFSGTAFANQQLTGDGSLLKDAIGEIGPSRVSGTDIGTAIITSMNILMPSEKSRAIIVLTDGQSNVGVPLDEAVAYVSQNKAVVHAIGLGTEQGGTFIRSDLVSYLDEEALISIADATGGRYFRAGTRQQIEDAYRTIATTRRQIASIELRLPLLLATLLFLFLEWGLVNTKFRSLP